MPSFFRFFNDKVTKNLKELKAMKTTYRWVDRNFEPILMALIFYVMTTIVTLQVILRFVFNTGFSWAEEVARFLFVWLMYFSISYATRNNGHINITFLVDKFNEKIRKIIMIFVDVLFFIFSTIIFISAIKICQSIAEYKDRAVSIDVSMNVLYAAGLIGFSLMIIRLIQGIVWKVTHFSDSMEYFGNIGGVHTGVNELVISPKDEANGEAKQ